MRSDVGAAAVVEGRAPLPDASVDVVIPNCVVTLSTEKPRAPREAARVLRPGGRLTIADILADPGMDDAIRRDPEAWTGCVAGALTCAEMARLLEEAGMEEVAIDETHRVHRRAGSAIVRARRPAVGGAG